MPWFWEPNLTWLHHWGSEWHLRVQAKHESMSSSLPFPSPRPSELSEQLESTSAMLNLGVSHGIAWYHPSNLKSSLNFSSFQVNQDVTDTRGKKNTLDTCEPHSTIKALNDDTYERVQFIQYTAWRAWMLHWNAPWLRLKETWKLGHCDRNDRIMHYCGFTCFSCFMQQISSHNMW